MNLELPVQYGLAQVEYSSPCTMDEVEAELLSQGNLIDPPVQHEWYPGLYVRTITMPKGSKIASKIHRTEHPFTILRGDVSVWNDATQEVVRYKTGDKGRTLPGTRRLLICHEETVWSTFHCRSDNETTVEQIEQRIIEPHFNELTGMTHKQMSQIANHESLVLHND